MNRGVTVSFFPALVEVLLCLLVVMLNRTSNRSWITFLKIESSLWLEALLTRSVSRRVEWQGNSLLVSIFVLATSTSKSLLQVILIQFTKTSLKMGEWVCAKSQASGRTFCTREESRTLAESCMSLSSSVSVHFEGVLIVLWVMVGTKTIFWITYLFDHHHNQGTFPNSARSDFV